MKLNSAIFSHELNGLSFCKNKCQEKSVSVKIAAKTWMFECFQRPFTFSHLVLVKFTKKQIMIVKTR